MCLGENEIILLCGIFLEVLLQVVLSSHYSPTCSNEGKKCYLFSVGWNPVEVTIGGYSNSCFFCVYCKRVKVFHPLMVTSLEGLQ